MFVFEDGLLKENELCKAPLSKYYEVYSNYVDSRLMTYLSTKYIAYFEATKYMSNMVLFLEIPVAYVLAGLVVYLLPPLIFKRGRRTVGKALYGVGLVNKDCLNLSGKQFAIRFVIFYFAISALFFFSSLYFLYETSTNAFSLLCDNISKASFIL